MSCITMHAQLLYTQYIGSHAHVYTLAPPSLSFTQMHGNQYTSYWNQVYELFENMGHQIRQTAGEMHMEIDYLLQQLLLAILNY